MELAELQNIWTQYSSQIEENTRINRTILKKMLQKKPKNRVNMMKIQAISGIIIQICITTWFVTIIPFRREIVFYVSLAGFFLLTVYFIYWLSKQYLLINRVSFYDSVIHIRKQIRQLEIRRMKMERMRYVYFPCMLFFVFEIMDFPWLSSQSILPLTLILIVFISSGIFRKNSISRHYQRLNDELNEIEQLEKD